MSNKLVIAYNPEDDDLAVVATSILNQLINRGCLQVEVTTNRFCPRGKVFVLDPGHLDSVWLEP